MAKTGAKILLFFGLVFAVLSFVWIIRSHAQTPSESIKSDTLTIAQFNPDDFIADEAGEPVVNDNGDLILGNSESGYQPVRTYTSEVLNINPENLTEFNALAASWQAQTPFGTQVKLELRAGNESNWSPWQGEASSGDLTGRDDKVGGVAQDGKGYSDLLIAENSTQYQYRIILTTNDSRVSPEVNEVSFTMIDSSEGPKAETSPVTDFSGIPNVISRTAWGCPEGEASPRWSPEYATKNKQVYHHTVTTNGAEPYATMRAIWYYHANTRGWGDIGYNYVVDQYGHIYKGRNGGKNVIGAHVYGYNTRSIGVALLGTYTSSYANSSAVGGISSIISYSAYLNNIGINLYGHRQLDSTQCPGDKFYAQKSTIVSQSNTKLLTYPDYELVSNQGSFYYYKDNTIRKFPNSTMVRDWGFDPTRAVPRTDGEIAAYTNLPEIKSFARYGSYYYLISRGQRHYFADSSILARWGINESNSVDLSADWHLLAGRTSKGTNVYKFIQKAGTSNIYVIDAGKKRLIPYRIFDYRGFNHSLIISVSANVTNFFVDGDIYPYPTGVLFRAKNQSSVYYQYNMTKRLVTSAAFRYLGYTSRKVKIETINYVDAIQTGNPLLYYPGKILRVTNGGSSSLFLVTAGFHRQLIMHQTIFDAWKLSAGEIVDESYSIYKKYAFYGPLSYPSGALVRGNMRASVYFMDLGQRRFISLDVYNAWNLDEISIVDAPQNVVDYFPKVGNLNFADNTILYVRTSGGGKRFYWISGGVTRFVPATDIYNVRHFYRLVNVRVSQELINVYPAGDKIYYPTGMLIRGIGRSGVYFMDNNQKRPVSSEVFKSWKFDAGDVRDISTRILDMIPDGAALGAKTLTWILGPYGSPVRLPAYSGKTAREQHLWLTSNESAAHHYAVSGTPVDCQNGMAGGYGAFGRSTLGYERYYVNMRWLYATWYEDSGGNTRTKDIDPILKSWHRHKKLIVINPATNKSVVVSIEEAGPAIWTDRVSGLSPEAMKVIGAVTNNSLKYYWAGSQSLPTGPID